MPDKDPRPPADVLTAIDRKSQTIRQEAEKLSSRIEQFEGYLGKLPGRVETICFGRHPDAKTAEDEVLLCLALRLHREGKEWILSWASYHEMFQDEPMKFSRLLDAPLRIKIAAVKMFSDFLLAIEKSQDKIVEELKNASHEYDEFMRAIYSLTPKGGK